MEDEFDVHRIINFSMLFVPGNGSEILIKSVSQLGIGQTRIGGDIIGAGGGEITQIFGGDGLIRKEIEASGFETLEAVYLTAVNFGSNNMGAGEGFSVC